METQAKMLKVGDKVTYQDVDMEFYSRGYGITYETKTATIVGVYYRLSNGDTIEEQKLTKISPSQFLESRTGTSPSETQKPPSNGQSLPSGQTGLK